MRAASIALVTLLASAPARAESPLARLAETLAEEIARIAKGRAVEVLVPEDRTHRGPAFARDFRELLRGRLASRVTLSQNGARLRVETVLTESGRRLVASARVVEEPGGALADVLSASAETDESLLQLSPLPTSPARAVLDVLSTTRTPPLGERVLDLALLGEERIAVLSPEALALYRWAADGLTLESRRTLPEPLATVRAPGGLLVPAERGEALWAMTSRSPRATLFRASGARLVESAQAAALPWPGCPAGLRYRPGTHLLEGPITGVGPGPFLAVRDHAAVSTDGQLFVPGLQGGQAALRIGPTLTMLWKGYLAASSPDPPGAADSILILEREEDAVRTVEALPVEGAVRALGSRVEGETARLVAAVDDTAGATYLLILDLRQRLP